LKFHHPAFDPYRSLAATLGLEHGLPELADLNLAATRLGIANAAGMPLRFVAPPGRLSARDYEAGILDSGCVPTRPGSLHDLLNALVWLRFPRFKAALNAGHVAAMRDEAEARRGRRRDALTVLDESGVWVVAANEELAALLSGRAWEELFWNRRDAGMRGVRFVVVGHALLEKALAPYPAMTGKCLLLRSLSEDPESAEDAAVAALPGLESPRRLPPLPVLGIPGWDANDAVGYYRNREVFRPLAGS